MVRGQSKEEVEISMISDKAGEKVKFEARARKNANAVNRAAVEADSKIRASSKIQGAKIERGWGLRQGRRISLRLNKRRRLLGRQGRQRRKRRLRLWIGHGCGPRPRQRRRRRSSGLLLRLYRSQRTIQG